MRVGGRGGGARVVGDFSLEPAARAGSWGRATGKVQIIMVRRRLVADAEFECFKFDASFVQIGILSRVKSQSVPLTEARQITPVCAVCDVYLLMK